MKLEKKSVYELIPLAQELFDELSEKISDGPFAFWEYINRIEQEGKQIRENIIQGKLEENVVIEGNLILGEGSVVRTGTRIEGNVFIGENCIIGPNAYLRGNTFIGNNCHIGICEIKNSIILKNTNIPHFSYVGDSILGEKVNFGAGTKVANLRFDDLTVKVNLNKKIDSGRRKLGVLVGHNTKTGINSSINCGIIIGNNCRIFPGKVVDRNLMDNEVFDNCSPS